MATGSNKQDNSIQRTADILQRQPPYDLEAERGVLGSILLKPDIIDEVLFVLHKDDFFDEANQKLYAVMYEMHNDAKKIDVMLLVAELKSQSLFELIGGTKYLAELGGAVPNAAHAVYYAEIVREKAIYRSLINVGTEILKDAYEQAMDCRALLSQAEQKVFNIADDRSGQAVSKLDEILHLAMDRMEARMSGEQTEDGVETHFTELDRMMGGFHANELLILAARPSMGKTALAMNISENVCHLGKAPVLFVSLEMSQLELCDRLLCSAARVNGHKMRNGTISNEDRAKLVEKAGELANAPLYVDDSPSRTVSEIASAARRIKRQHNDHLGLVVIDYLQLIEPDNPRDPRQEQVARIARRLKGLAREIKVPVLCLAQLNRQAEGAADHRPKLSHLRESGAIEQDADVVMFIHREEYYRRGEDAEQFAGMAEIIIAKQRNGPVGEIEVLWQKDFTRFVDKAPERLQAFDDFNSGAEAGVAGADPF
ncbi:MAG: replicative DNA helicase [Pirellulaceae bacterium]|jgi:replicative DNA helicase|nr:replicative DNA helicase [Pirellulaceae bacterium]